MSFFSRHRLWPYLIMTAFWSLLAIVYAGQVWMREPMAWSQALTMGTTEWLPWMVLSPVLFAVIMRFPLGQDRPWRAVLVTLLMWAGSVFAAEWIFSALHGGPVRPGLAGPGPMASGPGATSRPRLPPPDGFGPPPDFDGPEPGAGFAPGPDSGVRNRLSGPAIRGRVQHIMNFHVPMGLFVVMASNAYAYFLRMRERERKAAQLSRHLVEARLLTLQTQLQPHFLFNALNATAALIRRDPDAAEEMIANLSELLRLALAVRDRHEVTLDQELRHVESYLEIERVRFGDRLVIHRDIADAARPAYVPVLILQPLVENAIRHGIERRTADVGHVWIGAAVHEGRLRLVVTDNGPGPSAGSSVRRGHGVGLDNTRARLAALHGAAAELRLEPAATGGCMVTVDMPFVLQSSTLHETQSAHR